MDADLNLNTSGLLHDGTAASQKPMADSGTGVTAAQLRSGIVPIDFLQEDPYGNGLKDITDVPPDSLYTPTSGGFCGRPEGLSR